MKKVFFLFVMLEAFMYVQAQQVDYSVVSVPEESGLNFSCITGENDYVCMPMVDRRGDRIGWLSNRIIDVDASGKKLAYLSFRNNTTNIFIKDLDAQGSSIQRTNRSSVQDFSYSPDGKYLCFSETNGAMNQIFQTDAENGYVCRQITSGNKDYSPVYSSDMKKIFFARQETNSISIWSYTLANNIMNSYMSDMNPYPLPKANALLCARVNSEGRGEIWRVDYQSGVEECIVSDPRRSFTTPSLSPDGQWILFVGSSFLQGPNFVYPNTDIFVCRINGTQFSQITYHAADDVSPTWSKDGKNIYFISQRGSASAVANIWKVDFLF